MSEWHSSYVGKGSCIQDHAASFAQISSLDEKGGHGKVPKTLTVPTQAHTYAFTLCGTTLCYICSHMSFFFQHMTELFETLHVIEST